MPVVRQTKVSQDERDKYKMAALIGAPVAGGAAVAQHQIVHRYGRKMPKGSKTPYSKPKPLQFHQFFDPRKNHLSNARKVKGGAAWTAAMLASRTAGPLAAGGLVGLATTRQKKPRASEKAGLFDRMKAGTANAMSATKEKQPDLSTKDRATMLAATLGGGSAGAGATSLALDQRLRMRRPKHLQRLKTGRAIPHWGRALSGTAGAITGSAIGLKAISSRMERKHPDYRMTPFGLRYKEHVAVRKAIEISRNGMPEIVPTSRLTPTGRAVAAGGLKRKAALRRQGIGTGTTPLYERTRLTEFGRAASEKAYRQRQADKAAAYNNPNPKPPKPAKAAPAPASLASLPSPASPASPAHAAAVRRAAKAPRGRGVLLPVGAGVLATGALVAAMERGRKQNASKRATRSVLGMFDVPDNSPEAKRVERLNRMRSPASYRTGIGAPLSLAQHQLSANRHVRSDPRSSTLQRGVDAWSARQGPGVLRAGTESGRFDKPIKELRAHIKHAQPSRHALYRGMALPADEADKIQRRKVLRSGEASWARDPKVAQRFSRHRAKQLTKVTRSRHRDTQLIMAPGARSVHVAPLAGKFGIGMSEHITPKGRYRVVDTKEIRGRRVAHVQPHTPVVGWLKRPDRAGLARAERRWVRAMRVKSAGRGALAAAALGGTGLAGAKVGQVQNRREIANKADDRDVAGTALAGAGVGAGGGVLAHGAKPKPFHELPDTPERRRANRRLGRVKPGQVRYVRTKDLGQQQRVSGFRLGDRAQVASMAQYMRSGKAELQPIKVHRRAGGQVDIRDGAHRLQAAQMAGARRVPIYMEHDTTPSKTGFTSYHRRKSLLIQANNRGRQTDEQLARLARNQPRGIKLKINQKLSGHENKAPLPKMRYQSGRSPLSYLGRIHKSQVVAVVPVSPKERHAEARRKRNQAALSTGAALGTIASLGMRGGGAATGKWGAKALKVTPVRAKRIGQVMSDRAIDVGMGAGSIGAGSSLYFGRQQRREARELDKPKREVKAARWTQAEARERSIDHRGEMAKAMWRVPRPTSIPKGITRAPSPFRGTTYQRRSPTGRLVSVARRGGIG